MIGAFPPPDIWREVGSWLRLEELPSQPQFRRDPVQGRRGRCDTAKLLPLQPDQPSNRSRSQGTQKRLLAAADQAPGTNSTRRDQPENGTIPLPMFYTPTSPAICRSAPE